VVAALHRLTHTPVWADKAARRYSNEYARAHETFHEVLAAGCGSPWLLHLRAVLFNHSARYRWFTGPLSKVDRDLDKEHREIAEAALARDSEHAVALMNAHLQLTAKIVLEAVSSERGPVAKSVKAKAGEAHAPEGLPRKPKRGALSA
jgi:DNA-binding GntR family transcriptional regulator